MCETMQMDSKQPDWLLLDDLIMEKIFQQLSIRDRFNASLVCVLQCYFARKKTNYSNIKNTQIHFEFIGLSSMVDVF